MIHFEVKITTKDGIFTMGQRDNEPVLTEVENWGPDFPDMNKMREALETLKEAIKNE